MHKEEIAWLAGLLDGEGCFTTQPRKLSNGSVNHHPKITFSITDKDLASRVASLWSVKPVLLRKREQHHKTSWQVSLIGKRAADVMHLIYPWLSNRRKKKIEEILEIYQQQNINMGYSRLKQEFSSV